MKKVGERELDKGGQKVQMSTQKINKFWGCNVQDSDLYLTLIYGIYESW